jgi:3-methyladenine DNA glycosylase AlkC
MKKYFGKNLAELLNDKIVEVYPGFKSRAFISFVEKHCEPLELKARVSLIAESLEKTLPRDYNESIRILTAIMSEPNPKETGMFSEFYWLMPVGVFIERNGLNDFETSVSAIYELTQRNTGEYAVRPFIEKYPSQMIEIMTGWSKEKSFHIRRLASEGLRPKLPWAKKLDIFVKNYKPVFKILDNLKADPSKFVMKSVANNINDYLKLNYEPAFSLLSKWAKSENKDTNWIVKHSLRTELKRGNREAKELVNG